MEKHLITIHSCKDKLKRQDIHFCVTLINGIVEKCDYIPQNKYNKSYRATVALVANTVGGTMFRAVLDLKNAPDDFIEEITEIVIPKTGNCPLILERDLKELYSLLLNSCNNTERAKLFKPCFDKVVLHTSRPKDESQEVLAEVKEEPKVISTEAEISAPKESTPEVKEIITHEVEPVTPTWISVPGFIGTVVKIALCFGSVTLLSLIFGSINNNFVSLITNPFYPLIVLITSVILVLVTGGGDDE